MRVTTTFSIITDESAEFGDYADQGWIDEEGEEFETVEEIAEWIKHNHSGEFEPSSSHFHPGFWINCYGERDMYTGEIENFGFHFEGLTEDQEKELFSLFS